MPKYIEIHRDDAALHARLGLCVCVFSTGEVASGALEDTPYIADKLMNYVGEGTSIECAVAWRSLDGTARFFVYQEDDDVDTP